MTTYTKTNYSKAILAVLALVLFPGLASAASTVPMARSNEVGTFALGGTFGLSMGMGDDSLGTGIKATANGYYTITEFTPQIPFEVGGHIGFTYAGCGDIGTDASCTLTIVEVTPAARVRYRIIPKLSLYADFGLGFDYATISGDGGSDSDTALMMRLGSGIQYQISSQLYLIGEPLGFGIYFHDPSMTRYNLSGGILYRF